MKKKVIKIRIDAEDTRIYYSKKYFQNRVAAIQAAIMHLNGILDMYIKNTNLNKKIITNKIKNLNKK